MGQATGSCGAGFACSQLRVVRGPTLEHGAHRVHSSSTDAPVITTGSSSSYDPAITRPTIRPDSSQTRTTSAVDRPGRSAVTLSPWRNRVAGASPPCRAGHGDPSDEHGRADSGPLPGARAPQLRARADGRAVAVTQNAQRVLAFLAVRGRPQLRTTVASTLWMDTTDDRASANLRTALWKVRQQLGDLVRLVALSSRSHPASTSTSRPPSRRPSG